MCLLKELHKAIFKKKQISKYDNIYMLIHIHCKSKKKTLPCTYITKQCLHVHVTNRLTQGHCTIRLSIAGSLHMRTLSETIQCQERTKRFHQSAVMNNCKIKRIIPNACEPDETANERQTCTCYTVVKLRFVLLKCSSCSLMTRIQLRSTKADRSNKKRTCIKFILHT